MAGLTTGEIIATFYLYFFFKLKSKTILIKTIQEHFDHLRNETIPELIALTTQMKVTYYMH